MTPCILSHIKQLDNGYARIRVKPGDISFRGPGKVGHHKVVLEHKLGRRILAGLESCHTCDVKNCINEDHLYEGTHKENIHYSIKRRRRCMHPGIA